MKNMKTANLSNQLDNLLYSTSQYDDDDTQQLRKQLNSAQNRFIRNQMLDLNVEQESDDDQGIVLGNAVSMDADQPRWGQDDDKDEGRQWNHQQNAKYYFREVAGNSQNFSQSLSIHRPDLLQSKGMHENSVNMDTINIQNILNAKKKQQQKVNEVLNIEINDLVDKIQKQECFIKNYKKKIEDQQQTIQNLKKQNQQLDQRMKQYHDNLDKKDQLFNILKLQYTALANTIDEKQKLEKHLRENGKSMEKQIDRLRNVIKNITEHDKGLTDFGNLTPKRSESLRSFSSRGEVQNMEAQIEKLKRERKSLQTQFQIAKQDIIRRQQKYKNMEDDYRRKISLKQKRIKQLTQNIQQNKQEILKIKKTNDNTTSNFKQKLLKTDKDINLKQEKIKQLQQKIKYSLQEIKKKQQKIKQLLTEIGEKNKRMTQLKDKLHQEQGRNQIESKIQKQRDNQINKLQQENINLKNQNFTFKIQIQNLEKPTNIEQKLKKQIGIMKKQNENLTKQVAELNQNLNSLQKQIEAKDEKLRQFKKKNDELSKKSLVLSKKKSEQPDLILQNQTLRQQITKMTKQISELRKKAQINQQMANKLYILQSRIKMNTQKTAQNLQTQLQNQYDLYQINEALKQELDNKDNQIQQLKRLHQGQINRLLKQNTAYVQNINRLDNELSFKQKSLDYLHIKFVEMEKLNAQLKANKNILHSSFYDQTYDHQQNNAIHFYENKIATLQKKIENISVQLKKSIGQKQSLTFQITQLKNRNKDLKSMAISNQPIRKIAPQSLSPQQTVDFLMRVLKKIIKSEDMLRSLSKVSQFKIIIGNLWKFFDSSKK